MELSVAVVGAGVIGLSTALHLRERFPDKVKVTIIADKLSPDTASDRSSASVKPAEFNKEENDQTSSGKDYKQRMEKWFCETMKRFHSIHKSEHNSEVQFTLLTHYHLQIDDDTPDPWWRDLVFGFRLVAPDSVEATELFNIPSEIRKIWSYTAYTVNPTLYLQWMQKQFLSMEGTIKKTRIESLEEISGQYDVVINCTGVWAGQIVGQDESMQPARGQAVLVRAPWIRHCVHYDCGPKLTYIIPRSDSVALGGTLERGNWSDRVDEETTKDILKRCTEIEPSLAKAEVIRSWAGLRPLRNRIRLEKCSASNGKLIIHCYGHGGQGISIGWGCAKDIADIVQDEF